MCPCAVSGMMSLSPPEEEGCWDDITPLSASADVYQNT